MALHSVTLHGGHSSHVLHPHAGARHYGAMRAGDGWRQIDVNKLTELYVAYTTDTIAPACVRAIESRLLASGILYTTRDYSVIASSEFENHVATHFIKFVKDALVQLNVVGFCFFRVVDDVPKVIPLGLADVRYRLNTDDFTIEIGVFVNNNDEPDPNIFSIVDKGVDTFGGFASAMSMYYKARVRSDMFVRNACIADAMLARPPIYTTKSTDRVFDDRDIANIGEIENLRASLVQTEMQTREKLALDAHTYSERMVRALNTRSAAQVAEERVDAYSGLKNYDANTPEELQRVIALPLDSRVASVPQPHARSDIRSLMQHAEGLACIAFGVNPESVGLATRSGGHLGAATLERVNALTAETVARWARVLEPVLIRIYKLIWGTEEEANDAYQEEIAVDTNGQDSGLKSDKGNKIQVTAQEPDAGQTQEDDGSVEPAQPKAKRQRRKRGIADKLTVVFPSTLPAELVATLFEKRVLSYEAYINYLSTMLQLPISSFEKIDYRMVPDPSKPLSFGTEQAGPNPIQEEQLELQRAQLKQQLQIAKMQQAAKSAVA